MELSTSPSCRITSAVASRSRARTVSSEGSPGPAPVKYTLPASAVCIFLSCHNARQIAPSFRLFVDWHPNQHFLQLSTPLFRPLARFHAYSSLTECKDFSAQVGGAIQIAPKCGNNSQPQVLNSNFRRYVE